MNFSKRKLNYIVVTVRRRRQKLKTTNQKIPEQKNLWDQLQHAQHNLSHKSSHTHNEQTTNEN